MRTLAWGVLAAVGVALMVATHRDRMAIDGDAPWATALMVVGDQKPPDAPEGVKSLRAWAVATPASDVARAVAKALSGGREKVAELMTIAASPKLVALPPDEIEALKPWLRSGRLPAPDSAEVLAGSETPDDDLLLDGRTLKVVGRLRPDVALFAPSYVIPTGELMDEIVESEDTTAVEAVLLRLPDQKGPRGPLAERLAQTYPSKHYRLVTPRLHATFDAFALYLLGQAMLLLGGSALLFALYRRLASSGVIPILAAPLREIVGRPGLYWTLHVGYFGLYLAAALVGHAVPEVNDLLATSLGAELGDSGGGPLAVAARAYRTGSIPFAALVTFLVNYPLGTLAVITAPSLIIPGSGLLTAMLRASLWGLLLGPTESIMAARLIPHSGTLLLEGHGYILAAFFGVLVPIYLFGKGPLSPPKPEPLDEFQVWSSREPEPPAPDEPPPPPPRPSFWGRFGQALAINLQGSVLVAIVLIVAALYEAYEVIRFAGL